MISKEDFDYEFNENMCESCGGKCCYGESGYIFVSVDEMKKVAQFLGMPFEDLALRFVKKVGYRFSFIEQKCNIFPQNKPVKAGENMRCVFFNERTLKCDIYPVRPRQCRTFPFWEMYKKDKSELIERCIGICAKDCNKDSIKK